MKKLALILLALIVSASTVVAEEHACKADADCAHGEHCKDGHCHK